MPAPRKADRAAGRRGLSSQEVLVASVAAFIALAWSCQGLAGRWLVSHMYEGRSLGVLNVPEKVRQTTDPAGLRGLTTDFLVLLTLLCIGGTTIYLVRDSLKSFIRVTFRTTDVGAWRFALLSSCILVASSFITYRSLYYQGYEGDWYRLKEVIAYAAKPPFRHRVLFVLVANAVRRLLPELSHRQCYFLSQLPAIVLSFAFIRSWVELFVPRPVSLLSQPLLALMLIPTFTYFTFYDIGIVLFFTLALAFMVTQRNLAYLATFALATLNHENTLLLLGVFAALNIDRMPRKRLLGWLLLQLAVYAGVRLLLFYLLPEPRLWASGKLWTNLIILSHRPRPLVESAMALTFWYVLAAFGLRHAPVELRRCTVLLPLLLTTALVFGNIHEARLFDAFMPVAVALILCLCAASVGLRPRGARPHGGPLDRTAAG